MPRDLSPEFLEAIRSGIVRPAFFVEAHFRSGPIHVWTGLGSLEWNGETWLGLGSLGSISTIEEGSAVTAQSVTISLSGIDPTILASSLGDFQVGLPVTIWLALYDADAVLIPDPAISFSGRMDQPTLDVGSTTATISIACENRLADMNVSVERRYTNEDQRIDYPTDRGYEYVNSIQDITINWGRSSSN